MSRLVLTATYRLQMNVGFTLANARARVGYFADLGVSHLYLSPIFAARRGSAHGYDVVDPSRINPELGTEVDLRALAKDLHERNMGIILDVVPNHMGVGAENRYWDDVLTHGESSRYAKWFDIDWTHHKLILPILGDTLERVIERGELTLKLVEGETPRLTYFTHSFPIDPDSLPPDLQLAQVDPEEAGTLAQSYSTTDGRERLRELLDAQHYRLVFWRDGATQINYRRFFDVNDLAALRANDPTVFAETHRYLLELVNGDVVDGLRVDHIDGLRRPAEYLDRLRGAVPPGTPIFVEKILGADEQLPTAWPVQGTTGYEFLNDVDELFIDPTGLAEIEHAYRRSRRLGADATFGELARLSKMKMLGGPLRADVNRLAGLLEPLAKADRHRWSAADLSNTLIQLLAALPVYRTYIEGSAPPTESDVSAINIAAESACSHGALPEVVTFVARVLVDPDAVLDASARAAFIERFQQLSGPATAKGVEDTALYSYVPLASRNEVGGAPDRSLDDAVGRLHRANGSRAEHWPLSLLATNTHDTKRSADVRARLAALTEIPAEWDRSLRRWRRLNDKHRTTVRGRMAPDTNAQFLIYQTLIALWPPPRAGRRLDDLPDRAWRDSVRDRLSRYMVKAVREAKSRTSWLDPDPDYERAVAAFIERILQPGEDAPFLTDVARLVSCIATTGAINSLARIAVQLTSPGTPDTYQGDEFWNYSLVDPDNRRPVDYDARHALLDRHISIDARSTAHGGFDPLANETKSLVLHRLLQLRRTEADVFVRGSYRPLVVTGARAAHVVAFVRSHEERHAITVVPRLVTSLTGSNANAWWADTAIVLPPDVRDAQWTSAILGHRVTASGNTLEVATLFAKLPVMVASN
ncbi:MAG TPA: malto-oligosyltrehalose synthase [Gemmatimonadaceae bacterium]|jgi:(1->4)-alpha-D-glucan 1-alpha-D-glucosylmutase